MQDFLISFKYCVASFNTKLLVKKRVFFLMPQAAIRGIHYPRYEFLFYGWYADNWWMEEDEELQSLYNNSCSITDRERVIGPALSPLQNEFISNCSSDVDSGIVSGMMVAVLALHSLMASPINSQPVLTASSCSKIIWVHVCTYS